MNYDIEIKKAINSLVSNQALMKKLQDKFKDKPHLLDTVLYGLAMEFVDDLNPYEDGFIGPYDFLHNPYYGGYDVNTGIGIVESMHPKLREDFVTLHNPEAHFTEAILTGGIGWGKSFILSLGLIWQVYFLSKLKSPQKWFGLVPQSKISIMVISLTEEQSKKNVFFNIKELIKTIPYFQTDFPYDTSKDTKSLLFPKNIELFNGNSSEASAIGLNIYSACIDEANFFRVTRQSKRGRRYGEVYDQAKILYTSLTRRQDSRFLKNGKHPGIIYLASSKLFPNDFIEQRIQQIRQKESEGAKSHSYVMDYNLWTVNREKYGKEMFQVEVSEVLKRARILEGNETDIDGTIIDVPMEFYDKFKGDLDSALRDIAGIAIYSTQPFLTRRDKIIEAFDKDMPKIFSVDEATLSTKENISVFEHIVGTVKNKDKIRVVAFDLGLKKDAAGFAMGYLESNHKVERSYIDHDTGEVKKTYETAPTVVIEMVLRIVPELEVGEIEFANIRHLVFRLIEHGYKIQYASADGWQSVDMSQILRKKGINFELISVDRKPEAYDTLKEALYENRIKIVEHPYLREELLSLEKSYETGKVDHPPTGTKDIADAVCQVCFNLMSKSPKEIEDLLPSNTKHAKDGDEEYSEEEYLKQFERWTNESNYVKCNQPTEREL